MSKGSQKGSRSRGGTSRSSPKKNNKKSAVNPNKAVLIISLVFILAMGALVFFNRSREVAELPPELPQGTEYIEVIFHFPGEDGWEEELRQIELGTNDEIIVKVLTGLLEGPRRQDLQRSIPEGLGAPEFMYTQGTGEVKLSFGADFHGLSPRDRLTLINSLVYTLTELPFVEYVVFYAAGETGFEPILDGEGNPFGERGRDNTSLKAQEPPPPPITITLYFPDEQMMGLFPETREVPYNPLVGSLEALVVEALIQGPNTLGLSPVLPKDTAINSVTGGSEEGGLVIIDFTADFLNNLTVGSAAEEMLIFSLANSLTQIPENRHIKIFIDGLPISYDDPRTPHTDLSRPIERNESLIIGN
jgi:spore germination protein GerM